MEITLKEKVYEVCTNLRVPYEMQKDFGGKPYTQIFDGMKSSNLEDQVRIIYVAFRIANPSVMTYKEFFDLVLDEWQLNKVVQVISDIMSAVTGSKPATATDVIDSNSAEKKMD